MPQSPKRKEKPPPKPKPRVVQMGVIPEPKPGTRSVMVYTGEGTVVMRGEGPGNVTMECGTCSAPLIVGMKTSQLRNLVFKCKACGSFNETVV